MIDIESVSGCSMVWNVYWRSSCQNLIVAGPNRPCGRMARTMAPALVDFLNPEPWRSPRCPLRAHVEP